MAEQQFDVIVVGASLAGCTAATLYARAGLKVALVERNAEPEAYKHLCTHFIQPSATPTLQRLGLADPIEAAGGLRNSANLWTKWGWINDPALTDEQGAPVFGYSLRREVLDPLVRKMAYATSGVTPFTGYSVTKLLEEKERIAGITVQHANQTLALRANLVVAADGRNSRLAALAALPTATSPNVRGGVSAYYRNVPLKCGTTSQMWFRGTHVAYVFPNDNDITLITVMPPQAAVADFARDPHAKVAAYFRNLPDAPDISNAELLGKYFFLKDYPNQTRPTVSRGMALVGDAAASLDPLYGVGCGWAFQTAEWLVDETLEALTSRQDLTKSLAGYSKVYKQRLAGHQFVIKDFSKRNHFNFLERLNFRAAARDIMAARHTVRFGTRISSLREFLAPRALLRAVCINIFGGTPITATTKPTTAIAR